MIANIIKTIIKNAQLFIVVWAVVIIINQIFIFGACFAPYCIAAALPHTFVISALGLYFYIEAHKKEEFILEELPEEDIMELLTKPLIRNRSNRTDEDHGESKICPKCGSHMILKGCSTGKVCWKKLLGMLRIS